MGAFAIEVMASLVISSLVVIKLQGLLRRVGGEVCDRPAGADFWITYTQLMVYIGPLLLVSFFSRAGAVPALSEVAQIKSSLLVVLSGHFISLSVIGRAVWKSIFNPPVANAPAAAPAVPSAPMAPARTATLHGGES